MSDPHSHLERRRQLRRRLLKGATALLALGVVYVGTLWRPQLFFSWARKGAAIELRSDEAIPDSAAVVVALAESRIRTSPLFDSGSAYPVYICNTHWRWNYFSGFNDRSRAFHTLVSGVVFTRRAHWDKNLLAGPHGEDGDRALDVYIAHEVTHRMVADHLGALAARGLPAWLREGYAEYVARHDTFDYEATRARLIAGDEELVLRRSDPYLKYLLLVTHLLEHEALNVNTLLDEPPDPELVEARLRASAR